MPRKKIKNKQSVAQFIEGGKGYKAICIRCGSKTYDVFNAIDLINLNNCCKGGE